MANAMPPRSDPKDSPVKLLTDQILVGIAHQFSSCDHHPEPEHWKGLKAIVETIVIMALGEGRSEVLSLVSPNWNGKDNGCSRNGESPGQ
jgi:hypothetical protein